MGEMKIKTEVAGRVSALPLAVGAVVRAGDDIAIVEAMKMEIPVSSPASGTIKALLVAVGEMVEEAQALVIIET
jgi:acetyl-CoA carboxylase biotin carboxyl carrier protein